jgi:hypothetical protein
LEVGIPWKGAYSGKNDFARSRWCEKKAAGSIVRAGNRQPDKKVT